MIKSWPLPKHEFYACTCGNYVSYFTREELYDVLVNLDGFFDSVRPCTGEDYSHEPFMQEV